MYKNLPRILTSNVNVLQFNLHHSEWQKKHEFDTLFDRGYDFEVWFHSSLSCFQIKDKRGQVKEAKKQLKEAKANFKAAKNQKNKM